MVEPTIDDFSSWGQIEAFRSRVRAELDSRLAAWSDHELATVHDTNIDGETIRYSRGKLITHLLLHERGHHGDVTTLFYQLGIEAETTFEYRFYLERESGL